MTKINTSPKQAHFIVADLGKSNKKLILVDENLQTVREERTSIAIQKEKGMEWENVDAFLDWMLKLCGAWSQDFNITHLSISAHGATLGFIDDKGCETMPVMSYTSDIPNVYLEKFDEELINDRDLHILSSSPNLGFINLIRQIYCFEQLFPEAWEKTSHIMPYSSYLGYKLSGVMSSEISYLGNHSGLWNHHYNNWNLIAQERGYDQKFPKIKKAWDVLGRLDQTLAKEYNIKGHIKVLTGIHDSNASILPYIVKNIPNTTILSTGTWCLAMNMDSDLELKQSDLDIGAYHNISIYNKAFKTVGFTGGHEYAVWMKHFEATSGTAQESDYQKVITEKRLFIYPGIMGGSVFPGHQAGLMLSDHFFPETEIDLHLPKILETITRQELEAALNISLALQSQRALEATTPSPEHIVVEGGFIKSPFYLGLLAQLFPKAEVTTSALQEASAKGASCLALANHKGTDPMECQEIADFKLECVPQTTFQQLTVYQNCFIQSIHKSITHSNIHFKEAL
jgi:sugar (pentulose or hexulose) kinase